jgi:serine phosphatase RsbU (regulator of sigma subunit)
VTDGLTDQIGVQNGKRLAYGHRRLQLLLEKNHNEHVQDIAQRLREDFENWQGIEPRRDDVTVVLFKL